ncbi:hypothetical protein GWI33_010568 [Rhynchophorus ferrugineus]|uniref:Vesicle transport v-SNARE N-terminal domain-containing protein n=1 Tax=Rhynchophorus ferrugineus TaxID=354439 RepID=A0A834ISG4_RHYFE|nr:hypothetical protein GWI33_010568 [Rhynchophorus ferrugineus]
MVSLFENYEQQYSALTADITAQIGSLTASGSNRRQLISNIEKHVEEAQELLEQMDLEVREVESSKKQRCKTKLNRKLYMIVLKILMVIVETEEIGNQVLKNLAEQRETIQRSRNRLRETDEDLNRSSRTLNGMIMRIMQQKVILYLVGICFIVLVCFGVYLSFKK